MSPSSALPTDSEPTHHVTLTDRNGVTVGLVLCDAKGGRNARAIKRTPLRRQGIKISQGESSHGDLLPPFGEIDQDDFVGGLGMIDMEDRSRYYHGLNLDTINKRRMTIGPMPHFTAGLYTEAGPGIFDRWNGTHWLRLYGNQRYLATPFTPATGPATTFEIRFFIRSRGSKVGGDLAVVRLLNDSSGAPGTLKANAVSWVIDTSIPAMTSQVVKALFNTTLTGATQYWFEVAGPTGSDIDNCLEIGIVGISRYDGFGPGGPIGTALLGRRPEISFAEAFLAPGVVDEEYGVPPNFNLPVWSLFGTGVAFSVVSGKARETGGGSNHHFAALGGHTTFDHHFEADVTFQVDRAGVASHLLDGDDFVHLYTDGTNLVLAKSIAAAYTTVTSVAFAWAVGATKKMALRNAGSLFVGSVDGVDLVTGTISDAPAWYDGGLYSRGSVSPYNRFDNFATWPIAASRQSVDGSTYAAGQGQMRFYLSDDLDKYYNLFYEYKGAWYVVRQREDLAAAPKLWINGDRGVATGTQAAGYVRDTTKAWTADQWQGAVVKITAGPGRGQYAEISSNDADQLFFSTSAYPWPTVPVAGTSEYAIVGAERWTEITGHGLTGPVTDVLVSQKDVIYFAQGESVNIRRMREYVSGAVWTREYADDGTNKARFMLEWSDQDNGQQVGRAINPDNGSPSVARVATPAWGTNLVLGAETNCGRNDEMITGLERYGSPERMWVLTEGGLGRIVDDKYDPVPLREIHAIRSAVNGVGHTVHNLFLYSSLGRGGIERYYQDNFDDVGPNKDDGRPADSQGPHGAMVGYPGRVFAARGEPDASWKNTAYPGIDVLAEGWHPWYSHFGRGDPIRGLGLQVIPGRVPDRLWFGSAGFLFYLRLPSDVFDPLKDPRMRYHHQGEVLRSWNYFNYKDRPKFFDKTKLHVESLLEGIREIEALYEVDDATGEHLYSEVADGGQVVNLVVKSADGHQADMVQGKRMRTRLVLNTEDLRVPPTIKAIVHSGVVFLETKYFYDMTFRLKDDDIDLNGDPDPYTKAEDKATQLEHWSEDGEVLTFRCIFSPYDNHIVSIDPEALSPYLVVPDEQLEAHVAHMGLVELR